MHCVADFEAGDVPVTAVFDTDANAVSPCLTHDCSSMSQLQIQPSEP